MLRKKSEQQNTEVTAAVVPEGTKTFKKLAKRKGLTALAALLLLVAVAVIGTLAWYTRISQVTGMTMKAAQFDFNANKSQEDFILDVNAYTNIDNHLAAPGTGGVIPIRVEAADTQGNPSEIDADYTISIDFSDMADEFQNRIRFFYYTADGAEHQLSPKDTTAGIQGTLTRGQAKYEYIYWEWVYKLDGSGWYCKNGIWTNGGGTFTSAETDAFDAFDSQIGLGKAYASLTCHSDGSEKTFSADAGADGTPGKLYAYQKAMMAKLRITGAGAEATTMPATPSTTGTTRLKPTA